MGENGQELSTQGLGSRLPHLEAGLLNLVFSSMKCGQGQYPPLGRSRNKVCKFLSVTPNVDEVLRSYVLDPDLPVLVS